MGLEEAGHPNLPVWQPCVVGVQRDGEGGVWGASLPPVLAKHTLVGDGVRGRQVFGVSVVDDF